MKYLIYFLMILPLSGCHAQFDSHPDPPVGDIEYLDTNLVSWASMDLAAEVFILQPGDYTGLGTFSPPHTNGPKRWLIGNNAVLEAFNFVGIDNWTIRGVTFRGVANATDPGWGLASYLDTDSDNNIIEYCHFDSVGTGGALHVRDESDSNRIQHCLFTNGKIIAADNIAINVRSQLGEKVWNTKIMFNEIVDYTDGIQLNYTKDATHKGGHLPLTHIYGNKIYLNNRLTSDSTACAENAIDVKVGGTSESERVIIQRNLMYDFRADPTACGGDGSDGEMMIIQNAAQYVTASSNCFLFGQVGLKIEQGISGDTVKHIIVDSNFFYQIKKLAPGDFCTPLKVVQFTDSTTIKNNTMLECDAQIQVKLEGDKCTYTNNSWVKCSADLPSGYTVAEQTAHRAFMDSIGLYNHIKPTGAPSEVYIIGKCR